MTDETKKEGILKLGRRTVLKRGAVALPLLATIPSGASATANSSNYIGYMESGDADANDAPDGYIRCLDKAGVQTWDANLKHAHLYDDPFGYKIPAAYDYKLEAKDSATEYNADYVCDRGGKFFAKIKDSNGVYKWHEVRLPSGSGYLPNNGAILSASALSSFAGATFDKVYFKKIT